MSGLLERGDEVATLREAFDRATLGSGRLIFVAGEAGAGKSALVQLFCDFIAAQARVLTGWCDPLATPRPAGPLVDMARGLGPGVSSILHNEGRPGLFDAMYAELTASDRTTVVVFEDVHWADDTTLDLLRFLGRRVATAPCLILATYRNDETAPGHPLRLRLGDLASQAAVSRLLVPPLSLAAVTALANDHGQDASTLWTKTGGNAFFVTELLHAASDLKDGDVPATVADAVLARTARLSPAAKHALAVAAVLGPRSQPSVLLDIDGVGPAAIEECVEAGLLRLAPPVFMFRHEIVRQAVLSVTTAVELRQLSEQVLTVLRALPSDEDVLAKLAELAENAEDRDAVMEFAPAAARRAAALGAHREAAAQYARTGRFVAPGMRLAEILEALSVEHYLTGELAAAISSRDEALRIRRDLGQLHRIGDNLRWLSRLYWYAGDRTEGERLAAEALNVLSPLGPSPELAMALSLRSQLFMLRNAHEDVIAWGMKAIAMATELDLPDVLAHARNNVGMAQAALGDMSGLDQLNDSLALSLALNAEDHAARAYVNLSFFLVGQRLIDRASVVLDEGLAYCARRDLDLQTPYLHAARALMNVHRGRWVEASGEAMEVLALPGITPVHRFVALLPLALVKVRTGEPARETVDELRGLAHNLDETQRLAPYACLRAESAWLAGRPTTGDDELADVYRRTVESGDRSGETELYAWLHRTGFPSVEPPAHPVGPFHDAHTRPQEAADRLHRLGSDYDAAVCLTSGGEASLRRALRIFTHLRATPAAAIAHARLRQLGAIKIPRGPRPVTRTNPHGLTSRQLEILELVAEHRSNADIARRLFISERTVEHHVSAALAKLGVATREQAIRQLGHQSQPT